MLQAHKQRIALAGSLLLLLAAVLLLFGLRQSDDTAAMAGDKIIVTVTADSLTDLYGYQFQMNYSRDDLEYTRELYSKIGEMSIYDRPFDDYQLIRATMSGDQPGISGKNVPVCQLSFIALNDCEISDALLSLNKIGVFSSKLEYETDVAGWAYRVKVEARAK